MSSFIPYQQTIGLAFSIAGLSLVCFNTYIRRTYSPTLTACQLFYLFAMILTPSVTLFSNQLNYSWLSFMPNFLNYCSTGDFSCTYGYLISPSICWAGAAVLSFIIIKIIARSKPNAKFQPFYNFYKGFLRWTFAPLIYFCTTIIIKSLQYNSKDTNFYGAIIVLAYFLLIVFLQLIGYKCVQTQKQNNAKKWIQFFDHARVASMVVLIAISNNINNIAMYILYAPIILFDLLYLIKYNFAYKVFERILFALSQCTFITLYSLFLFGSSYINKYNLDIFGLAIIVFIQLLTLLIRAVYKYKNPSEQDSQVNPEQTPEEPVKRQEQKALGRKQNSFIADANLGANLSYQQLNEGSSPRKQLYKEQKKRRK